MHDRCKNFQHTSPLYQHHAHSANNDHLKHATLAASLLGASDGLCCQLLLAPALTPLPLHLHSALECRDVIEDALRVSQILCVSCSSGRFESTVYLLSWLMWELETPTLSQSLTRLVWQQSCCLAQHFKLGMLLGIHFISAAWPHGTVNNWLIDLLSCRSPS